MAENEDIEATLYCKSSGTLLARVKFDCRLIQFSDTIGSQRTLHLFRIIEGQFNQEAENAHDLLLKANNGWQAMARIAAMPVAKNSAGFPADCLVGSQRQIHRFIRYLRAKSITFHQTLSIIFH